MLRQLLVAAGAVLLLTALGLASGVMDANSQGDDQLDEVPITTSAVNSVGIGSYVAAEAYAVPAGDDPDQQPVQAIIMPYGITPDKPVMAIDDFQQPDPAVEGFTFEWSLAAPDGSEAEVMPGTVGIFMADVAGQYDLTLTATDADDNSGSATWTVWATTYVGVGGFAGGAPEFPECGVCHTNTGRAWYATDHATVFIRGINGALAYPLNFPHHTTGFNNRPEADNGGFDDVVRAAGWTLPDELTDGNWQALRQEYPDVAALANIQCESCHGPGALHPTSVAEGPAKIGRGLATGTCAQCHADSPDMTPQQWDVSSHADKTAQAFWYPIGEDHASCVRCHSGAGFIDWAKGKPPAEQRTEYQTITCAVCHDPHSADSPGQLRVFDSVILPDGTDTTAAGPAATCMSCHNTRVDPTESVMAAVEGGRFNTPHYSTAAELMYGTGGYEWDATLPSSMHGAMVDNTCIACHMADTPGVDDMGTPDDPGDDEPLPGHNMVGGHTFAMTSADGVQNIASCQACHPNFESFAVEALQDYDGDGTTETGQDEIAGLRELLQGALEAEGVVVLDHYPYFEIPDDAGENIYGGIYNFKFAQSGGSATHNLQYTVGLLQLSYEKVTGEPVPDADLIY
jgi:hypothetical protein